MNSSDDDQFETTHSKPKKLSSKTAFAVLVFITVAGLIATIGTRIRQFELERQRTEEAAKKLFDQMTDVHMKRVQNGAENQPSQPQMSPE